jgi:hypothetical protein
MRRGEELMLGEAMEEGGRSFIAGNKEGGFYFLAGRINWQLISLLFGVFSWVGFGLASARFPCLTPRRRRASS